jgi:hypothetical protein
MSLVTLLRVLTFYFNDPPSVTRTTKENLFLNYTALYTTKRNDKTPWKPLHN